MQWMGIPSRGGVVMLLVISCYGDQNKLRLDGLLVSNTDFSFTFESKFSTA